jgi:CRP-like cAMP-binding protein
MLSPPLSRPRNQLLAALSSSDFRLLQPHLSPVTLKLRTPLEIPNRRIEGVYFIETGIASIVATHNDGDRIEAGLIGFEGMSGTSILLNSQTSPNNTYLQVAGEGKRIPTDAFRQALDTSKTLHGLLLKYVQVLITQAMHTAIANARGRIDRRLARWLLMAHDRVSGDTLPLTHEFLALMLGVRRPGVTEALHALSSQKLIRAARGEIIVLSRKGLERVAGELYGVPEAEYRRLISTVSD